MPHKVLALDVGDQRLPLTLRRNPRARRLILRLDKTGDGVVVTVPDGCSEAEAVRFAGKHTAWIDKHLAKRPAAVAFADGARVPVRGQAYLITHCPDRRGTVWTEADGANDLEAAGDAGAPRLCVAGERAHLPRRVRDWLKREARRDLKARCAVHAQAMGLSYKRVDLRDQTTRWGSCSSSGVLSFSWRLILAPEHVLDYVAAHEVAHLKEMNHSKRFWALVDAAVPDMTGSRKWLKVHGGGLHRYGVEERGVI